MKTYQNYYPKVKCVGQYVLATYSIISLCVITLGKNYCSIGLQNTCYFHVVHQLKKSVFLFLYYMVYCVVYKNQNKK